MHKERTSCSSGTRNTQIIRLLCTIKWWVRDFYRVINSWRGRRNRERIIWLLWYKSTSAFKNTEKRPQAGAHCYASHYTIQLFRQRLSNKSVKAYANMPIGMGSKNLGLLDLGSRCLARRKDKLWIHGFVLLPFTRWNILSSNHGIQKCLLLIISFDIVAHASSTFLGTAAYIQQNR